MDKQQQQSMADSFMITASENVGIGLWTFICVRFAAIFGVRSENYLAKQNNVANHIKKILNKQATAHPDYEMRDVRIVFNSPLSATGTALLVKKK